MHHNVMQQVIQGCVSLENNNGHIDGQNDAQRILGRLTRLL